MVLVVSMTPVMLTDSSGKAPVIASRFIRAIFIKPHVAKLIDEILTSVVHDTNSDELVAMTGLTFSASGGKATRFFGFSISLQRVCSATECEFQYVVGVGMHSSRHADFGVYAGLAGIESFEEMYGPGGTVGAAYSDSMIGSMFEIDYYPNSDVGLPMGVNIGKCVGKSAGKNFKIEATYTGRFWWISND